MGIEISEVYYSGFWSQGDGACFEGGYSYVKGSVYKVKEHAPLDTELHRIVTALALLQHNNFYKLSATVKHRGYYYHENRTDIDIEGTEKDDTENSLKELLRDFMRWIYSQLEKDYEFQNSDETVDENIIANEYEFTEEGNIA